MQGLKQSQRWFLTFFNIKLQFAHNVESVKSNPTFRSDLNGNSLYLLFAQCEKKNRNKSSWDVMCHFLQCWWGEEFMQLHRVWRTYLGKWTFYWISDHMRLDLKAYWIRLNTSENATNDESKSLFPDVPHHLNCISREVWVNSPQHERIDRNFLYINKKGWLLVTN